MDAVLLRTHGGPDRLVVERVPDPRPGPGETLVRVRARAVEPGLDVKTRRDAAGWPVALPHVLGTCSVGEIVEGPAAGGLVAVAPSITCGECPACLAGRDDTCARRTFMGVHRWGGYAELLTAPTRNLLPLPTDADPGAVASALVTFPTAWNMVVTRAAVQPGETVLVFGATGAVGVAAAQIARHRGARVLLAGRDPDRLARAAVLTGADVLPPGGPVPSDVDLVVDTVGAATWPTGLAALRPGGRLTCCGGASGDEVTLSLRSLYRRNISLHLTSGGSAAELRTVLRLVGGGELAPAVGGVLPWRAAAEAHRAQESGHPLGRLVLADDERTRA
ncbi:zinc-binding dehydrogenase [Pseudonocardia sp. ICBG1034]|uniref:zinc-binding dehydrogenase n=1 Tax=Pseudonocardia sp. ICBG1034 TaxID=2844381 RepID=UPI001CCFD444|nr:alcohol dehydrogenase catalytic domain-containing protein [Pseudonocardia sp. ICBG1034]